MTFYVYMARHIAAEMRRQNVMKLASTSCVMLGSVRWLSLMKWNEWQFRWRASANKEEKEICNFATSIPLVIFFIWPERELFTIGIYYLITATAIAFINTSHSLHFFVCSSSMRICVLFSGIGLGLIGKRFFGICILNVLYASLCSYFY